MRKAQRGLLQQASYHVHVLAQRVAQAKLRLTYIEAKGWDTHFAKSELERWERLLANHVVQRDRLAQSFAQATPEPVPMITRLPKPERNKAKVARKKAVAKRELGGTEAYAQKR